MTTPKIHSDFVKEGLSIGTYPGQSFCRFLGSFALIFDPNLDGNTPLVIQKSVYAASALPDTIASSLIAYSQFLNRSQYTLFVVKFGLDTFRS